MRYGQPCGFCKGIAFYLDRKPISGEKTSLYKRYDKNWNVIPNDKYECQECGKRLTSKHKQTKTIVELED